MEVLGGPELLADGRVLGVGRLATRQRETPRVLDQKEGLRESLYLQKWLHSFRTGS